MYSISDWSNCCFIIINNFFILPSDTLDIPENALKNMTPLEMDNFGLKKKYSSLKMENITVVKLKTFAKQRGIKGYYKLRKDLVIQKLETHPDLNEQVLIPGLEIPRNTIRSVNTSAILDDPLLDDKTPVLHPTPNFIPKSIQKINILVDGC